MGSVYRARHALLRRPTAVKIINSESVTPGMIARFGREVQVTSQLCNAHTITIFDYGRTPEGVFFYAMEYLDGLNLDDLVARFGPLPEGRVIHLLRQVCESLAEAHAAGLIHRDIKPANLIVGQHGGVPDFVKVLDFGLAKHTDRIDAQLTAAGSWVGTPLYVAPEAIRTPEAVDTRADLYAVGAVGYYLLTGTTVFTGETVTDICMHHLQTPPEPPSIRLRRPVATDLEDLLLQCLAKDPGQRPASAAVLDERLEGCQVQTRWTRAEAARWWMEHGPPAHAEPGRTMEAPVDPSERLVRLVVNLRERLGQA
jgi:serine/threonine protein kinase